MIGTALRIAVRDLRSSWRKFLFVMLAVAAGVGALTGVRGFSESFRDMLSREARTLIASDLFVRIFSHPTPEQQKAVDSLEQRGAGVTQVSETVSMVASEAVPDPVLVTLKAVDPQVYPFYGVVELSPAGSLKDMLADDASVLASEDLLLRLRVKMGDQIRVGGQPFRIAGLLVREPDRMAGTFSVGPRIIISREGLKRTGLVGVGSRASQRLLFRTGRLQPVAVENELRRAFPEALVVNVREINPNIARGLDRATTFLSLVSLIALVVGSIGVAAAMHAHLQTRMDSIAVMKSIGGRSSQITAIYVLQTLILGLIGGIVGVIAGYGIQSLFPVLMDRFLQLRPEISFSPLTAMQGLGVGVLTTMLFTIPPLLGIRHVRPALILRRDMPEVRPPWQSRFRELRQTIVVGAVICTGLALIASSLVSGTWDGAARVGGTFVGALAVSLVLLSGVAGLLLNAMRAAANRMRWMPMTLRHAVANLYRPGSQSRAVLTALGTGVMFTLTIYLVQRSVLDEIRRSAPGGMANVFFLDITQGQKDALAKMVSAQPGMQTPLDVVATVSCRLESINDVPVGQMNISPGAKRRYQMARNVSAEAAKPAGLEVVQGAWWKSGDTPSISISQEAARRLNVDVGSTMKWMAYGREIQTTVAALHRTEQQRLRGMLEFHMNPEALTGLPTVYYAGGRVDPSYIGRLQRTVYERFPTVTVINVADVLERVEEVVDQIALIIRFLSGFAIFAGIVILASSVAGTRFRRVREMAVFKTLGATRRRMIAMFSAEFLIIGAAAGLIGSLLASAFSYVVLRRFFEDAPYQFDGVAVAVSALGTALLASVAGWLASFRILGQKPLEVLRGE